MDEVDKIAREAHAIAIQVRTELLLRYDIVDSKLAEVKALIAWVGGVFILLMISVLGWSLAQQYNANEAQKHALEQRASDDAAASSKALKEQLDEMKRAEIQRAQVLEALRDRR